MIRANELGLYHVVGSNGHTTYDENNKVTGGGCDGEKHLYFLAYNIDDVINKINTIYNSGYKHNGEINHFTVTLIEELDYTSIQILEEK